MIDADDEYRRSRDDIRIILWPIEMHTNRKDDVERSVWKCTRRKEDQKRWIELECRVE